MRASIVCSFVYGAGQTREIYRRRDLERMVETILQWKRIILLQSGTYRMEIANLLKRFPSHTVYTYRYPGQFNPGVDEKVRGYRRQLRDAGSNDRLAPCANKQLPDRMTSPLASLFPNRN